MGDVSIILNIIWIIILLSLSFIFSATETSFIGSSELKLKNLSNEKNKKAEKLLKTKEKPEDFISTIIIANNFVNVLAASIATVISLQIFKTGAYIYSSLIMTFIIVVFAELLPKTLSSYDPENYSLKLFPFYNFFSIILKPISNFLNYLIAGIIKIFGKNLKKETKIEEGEFKTFLSMSSESGTIEEEEKQIIESVIEFHDKQVYEVMVPRVDVVLLPIDTSLEKIIETIISTGHSRIPIYEGNIDNIIGIIHVKDLLKLSNLKDFNLKDYLHEPIFVPDTKKIAELFKEMRKKKNHMAIVLDEFGGFEGIVTMEDLLEEIVGEIQDEYDLEEVSYRKISEKEYIIDAKLTINDVEKILNLQLPKDDYDTFGGFFLDLLGHIPNKDEKVSYNNISLTAIEVKGNRIIKIKVEVNEEDENQQN
ncbi:MAG TPA: hemolysin family protein [Caldisericia bacterium]|nr:hemolysin family protein [Caldisericia bacterium]HPC56539.1 hemolysin family protein [Caldisericia bacterium]HPP42979.1 hemolysin family protein [Caldisericia bacterium]